VIVLAVPEGNDVAAIARTVDARLQAAAQGRAAVDADEPRQIRCRLVASVAAEDVAGVALRARRCGVLEFRILAARKEIAKRGELGSRYRTPPDHRLVMAERPEEMLVEVPEAEALARLEAARVAGDDEVVIAQLQEALDRVRAEHVFGGVDVASAQPAQVGSGHGIHFQIESDRRDAFERFTGNNVNRQLAILIDGRVEAAPRIVSALRGEGVITGRGGFSAEEAALFSAILDRGLTLPVELELVRIEEPR
jgi:preprotein translocase subunit SecD